MFTRTRKWNKKNLNREHTEICGVVGYMERWFIWWKSQEESYSENVYTDMKIKQKKLKEGTHIIMWSCCIYRKVIYLMKESRRKLRWKCLHEQGNKLKACVRYIFTSLFCKSKKRDLWSKEKCCLFHFESSFRSWDNKI